MIIVYAKLIMITVIIKYCLSRLLIKIINKITSALFLSLMYAEPGVVEYQEYFKVSHYIVTFACSVSNKTKIPRTMM